ncbi:MAG: enoyl-CoA hydratase [Actinobacteria bacterium]|nr:enoyl-CoA hydratase [Actinomycetota bacterium]
MSLLRVERRDRVAVLTLDDPDHRNALSRPLVEAIVAAVDEVEADEGVGAVVVTGTPPAFCAGADLSDLGARSDGPEREAGLRAIYDGFLRVASCRLPTVAAVNGPAVGAGLNLAMACDVRVAGEEALFDSRFLAIGLHPGGGGTWLLHRAIGPQATAALSLFGERVDGRRAVEIGLAWECVVADAVVERAVELAARAAAAPRALAIRVKETLRRWDAVSSHDEAVEAELEPQLWSIEQPEFAERLEALRRTISTSGE